VQIRLDDSAEQASSTPRRMFRSFLMGLAATLALVAWWTAMSGRGSATALISNAVMVRPIENLSGDPSLDETGRWATYLVSNALAGIDTVRVVSADEVSRILRMMEETEQLAGADPSRELTRQTRTALALESSMYLRSDSILLEARLMDSETAEAPRIRESSPPRPTSVRPAPALSMETPARRGLS